MVWLFSFQLPDLTGLPQTTTISDETPIGTTLHTFNVIDSDDKITCSVDPPENTRFNVTDTAPSKSVWREIITILGHPMIPSLLFMME